MSIFSDYNYLSDATGAAVSPQTSELRAAISKMMLAHEATAGCKPNEEQLRAIMFHSGAAATAIIMAMSDACKAFAEVSH